MEKLYTLKAIRPLMPMAREAPPLLGSIDPFCDGTEPWIVRYIVDSHGFWLQINDKYGVGDTPLSHHGIFGMTRFNVDDLEVSYLGGVGNIWGSPGGLPILQLPCTARQFQELDNRMGGLVLACFPLGTDAADQHMITLELHYPDAAELARFIISGVEPLTDTAPAMTTTTPAPMVTDQTAAVENASDGPAKPTATVGKSWVLKKAVLIGKHARQWPTINRDFQDASENGLSRAAKAPGHGNWFEDHALIWARQRGKLSDETGRPEPIQATPFGGLVHRIMG